MYARKIAQIAESRRHLRRDCGSLTYRRPKKRSRKVQAKQTVSYSRKKPLFLIFLFFVSQFFFLKSSLFSFRELEVKGASSVDTVDIEKKLGLSDSSTYWDLSEGSLLANLQSLHRLNGATVSVEFPGRVQVMVSERKPSFFVAYRRDARKWFSVDSDGVVLDIDKPQKGALKFYLPHPVKGGTQVREGDLQVVRYFQDQLSEDLKKRVRAINISNGQLLALKVIVGKRPVWVKLGRAEKLGYKLFLLQQLLTQLSKEKSIITSIDLRYSAPVVRKKPLESDS